MDVWSDLARLDGVPSAVAAARDAVDAVLRDRGRRAVEPEASATARVSGAKASVELEVTLDPTADRWLPGAVRVATQLVELGGLIRTAPGQAIARTHALLGRGLLADDELGQIKAGAPRLAELNRRLAAPTTASSIVVAAIAHAELAVVRPFAGPDGIVARAVEHMILIEGGVDPDAVIIPEMGHRDAGPAYTRALQGYAIGGAAGVRDWIVHCAESVARGAESSPLARFRR